MRQSEYIMYVGSKGLSFYQDYLFVYVGDHPPYHFYLPYWATSSSNEQVRISSVTV